MQSGWRKQAAKHANADNASISRAMLVPEVVRPARVIWNQAIGVLFFVLAIPAAGKGIQLYRKSRQRPERAVSESQFPPFSSWSW